MSSLFCTYSHCSFVHNLHFVRLKNKAITKWTSPCPKKEGVEDGQTTNNAVETCPRLSCIVAACTSTAYYKDRAYLDNANRISLPPASSLRLPACIQHHRICFIMTLARQQTSHSEADPTLPVSQMSSPSPSCHGEKSVNGLPTYAAPSIFPPNYDVPSGIDHTSQFFEILTAPYCPPASPSPLRRTTPRQEDVERCAAMVDWGDTGEDSTPQEGSSTSQRKSSLGGNSAKDTPIYVPHGPCAWAAGEDIQQTETLLSLRRASVRIIFVRLTHDGLEGSMCSAYIQSGVIAGRKITFISRR